MKKIIFVFFCFICSVLFVNAKQLNNELFNAVADNDMKEVQALIEKGADVKVKDKNNLSLISYSRDKEMIEYLLSKGAGINDINTALILGKTDLAKEMINKGFDIYFHDFYGLAPIHYAAFDGQTDIVKILLEKGVDVNYRSKNGETPLMWAAGIGDLKMVKFLVKNGADVNAARNNGLVSLHYANYYPIIKYLVKKGADVNAISNDGETVLQYIAYICQDKAVKLLLQKGADPTKGPKAFKLIDNLADSYTCGGDVKKQEKILRMLIKKGIDINMLSPYETVEVNALDYLLHKNNKLSVPHVKMMQRLGAKRHKITDSAIAWYTKYNDTNGVKFLIEEGFDINIKDEYGKTALDYAKTDEMNKLLLKNGAKFSKDL